MCGVLAEGMANRAMALTSVRLSSFLYSKTLQNNSFLGKRLNRKVESEKAKLPHLPVRLAIGNLCFCADFKIHTGNAGSHMSSRAANMLKKPRNVKLCCDLSRETNCMEITQETHILYTARKKLFKI